MHCLAFASSLMTSVKSGLHADLSFHVMKKPNNKCTFCPLSVGEGPSAVVRVPRVDGPGADGRLHAAGHGGGGGELRSRAHLHVSEVQGESKL